MSPWQLLITNRQPFLTKRPFSAMYSVQQVALWPPPMFYLPLHGVDLLTDERHRLYSNTSSYQLRSLFILAQCYGRP